METVYFIATYDITDAERYESEYVPAVVSALAAAGGEVIVASGSGLRLEGAAPGHTVVVRFPSNQAFREWYDSDRYAPLKQLRLDTTANGSAVLVNEFPRSTPPSLLTSR
jgi:uncharacterized protein (DUF1330 family)